MISTGFAPNEDWDDAFASLKLLYQPWKWLNGKETLEVKKQILNLFNIEHLTWNVELILTGRAALFMLLQSLKVPNHSEVLIQAFTCEAVVLPILANHLKPIYVDIESESFSMQENDLQKKLSPKSKVLILQHTFGIEPKSRTKILEIAKKNNLIVIEDLAHGFNAKILNSKNLTSDRYYLLSFGRSKSISSVFGGAIISPNIGTIPISNNLIYPSYWFIFRCLLYKPLVMIIKSTYDLILGKIVHSNVNRLHLLVPEITKQEKMGHYDLLFNKSFPNAFAVLLLNQFKKIERTQENRAEICTIYNGKLLKKITAVIRFPVLVSNRDNLLTQLRKKNIFLGRWYDQVVAPKDIDLDRVGYMKGSCPQAEEVCKKIINLPTNISQDNSKRVINALNDVMRLNDV